VLSYVFYWVMVIVVLVHLKYKEVSSFSASFCHIHTIVNRVAPSFLDGSLQQAYVDGSQANNGQNNSR
jgi:hypothetical protein